MDNINENEIFSFGGNDSQEDFSYSDISDLGENNYENENIFSTENSEIEEPKYEASKTQQFDPFAFVPSNALENNDSSSNAYFDSKKENAESEENIDQQVGEQPSEADIFNNSVE